MTNGEWRIGAGLERADDQIVSRLARVAGCNDACGELLPIDPAVSTRRIVRAHVADSASCRFNSSQHCGRSRTRAHSNIRSIPANFTRFAEGVGNTLTFVGSSQLADVGECRNSIGTLPTSGKDASSSDPDTATEERLVQALQFHSPFAIRHSRSVERFQHG